MTSWVDCFAVIPSAHLFVDSASLYLFCVNVFNGDCCCGSLDDLVSPNAIIITYASALVGVIYFKLCHSEKNLCV